MTTSIFLLVLFSAFCHAGWNLAARKAAGNLVVFWLGVWLGCGLLLPAVIVILIRDGLGQSFQAQAVVYIIATGVIHAFYYVLLGAAYEHGEISVVYPVARGSGIALTATLAWLILKEGISVLGSIGIGLICVGVISMSLAGNNVPGHNPPGGKKGNEKALLSALGVGVTIVAYSLVDKVGVGYVNPIIYIWSMYVISGLLLFPFVLRRYSGEVVRIVKRNIKFSLIIGFGSIITYLMILFAYTLGPVSYIVAIREFAVVLGAVAGIVFLKEKFMVRKLIAIVVIVTGMVFIKVS